MAAHRVVPVAHKSHFVYHGVSTVIKVTAYKQVMTNDTPEKKRITLCIEPSHYTIVVFHFYFHLQFIFMLLKHFIRN